MIIIRVEFVFSHVLNRARDLNPKQMERSIQNCLARTQSVISLVIIYTPSAVQEISDAK